MVLEHRTPARHDLVILGGGPAGMSAALIAGRALLDTVVVDAGAPRNAVTTASHGFLTRDGAHPTELLEIAKDQLTAYETVRYVAGSAAAAEATADGGFEVVLADGGRLVTDRLVIATGHTDDLGRLALAGIDAVYGRSVYPCVFCDGFEHRGERLALFGREGAIHYAPMVRLWTDDLVVFTNGTTLSPDEHHELERNGVPVRTEPIRELRSDDGRLVAVELETGERVERDAGFISDEYSDPATDIAESLGVTSSPNDWGATTLDASDVGATNVAGLYVIGDARTGFSGLVAAAAEGAACAETIVHQIATERWSER